MEIAIVLTLLLLIQNVFTFIQVRSYRKSMNEIVNRYKGKNGYYLFSDMQRRKLLPGAMAMLIVDESYIIQECYFVNGVTVLSKFKEYKDYKGQHVGVLLREMQEKTEKNKKTAVLATALSKAAENALISISKKNISGGLA